MTAEKETRRIDEAPGTGEQNNGDQWVCDQHQQREAG
jgi:hypothetical protein